MPAKRLYTIRRMASIETARLLLRLPAAADAEPFMDFIWDPEVVEKKQVTLTEAPGDVELARRKTSALVDHWASKRFGLWTVVEKSSGQVIGCVGLQEWTRLARRRTRLGHPPVTVESGICHRGRARGARMDMGQHATSITSSA